MSPEERFEAKYERADDGCWLWTAYRFPHGYGLFFLNRRREYAHRAAYRMFVGPIPEGYEIDHLCRVRACVNPAHLEAVTRQENVRRALPHRPKFPEKTCRRGHPLEGDNAALYEGADHTQRRCRRCHRERARKRRARLKTEGREVTDGRQ